MNARKNTNGGDRGNHRAAKVDGPRGPYDHGTSWALFRTGCRALLEGQRHAMAVTKIGSELIDGYFDIVRKEQEAMLRLTERMLENLGKGPAFPYETVYESLSEIREIGAKGLREFDVVMRKAQQQSLEALRERSRVISEAAE